MFGTLIAIIALSPSMFRLRTRHSIIVTLFTVVVYLLCKLVFFFLYQATCSNELCLVEACMWVQGYCVQDPARAIWPEPDWLFLLYIALSILSWSATRDAELLVRMMFINLRKEYYLNELRQTEQKAALVAASSAAACSAESSAT